MRKIKIAICLAIAYVAILACGKPEITIAQQKKSNYSISFQSNTEEVAIELKKYLKESTGADLKLSEKKSEKSINLILDPTMSKEAIAIQSDDKKIEIKAQNINSLYSACYEFLEKYVGVKFYSPKVEFVPKLVRLAIPQNLNYYYEPKVSVRTVHSILFYENEDFSRKHKVTKEAFPFYAPGSGVHTFHKFVPAEKYLKSHPEYFALLNGKRYPTQLCLSNPEVVNILKKSVKELFEKHPESSVISVSSNDNTQYCTCEQCAKIDKEEGAPSGIVIRVVNEIAKEFPAKKISTLAYQYTRKAPKTKPADNVLITLCSIEADRSAPLTEKSKDFVQDVKDWNKLGAKLRIWDYTTQFTNFLAPFPNFHTIKPNIEFFVNNNATWIFEQHSANVSELFELRSYLMAKLLWNPNLKTEDIIHEFTEGYYGEAGKFVRKYINRIQEELAKYPKFFLFLYGDPSQAFNAYLKPELLSEYDDIFNQAFETVKGNKVMEQRINEARLSIDFAILEAYKANLNATYRLKGNTDAVRTRLSRFANTCEKANVRLMNEMGFKPSEYIQSIKDVLKRVARPNLANGKKVNLYTKPKKYGNEDPQTLTDGAIGGYNFYANWLGFEGNHLEAVIDLEKIQEVREISTAFLQVVNHVVFFPEEVSYFISTDNKSFKKVANLKNQFPLNPNSRINFIQNFDYKAKPQKARYIKLLAKSLLTAPDWHHGAGMPAWIFADEVMVR